MHPREEHTQSLSRGSFLLLLSKKRHQCEHEHLSTFTYREDRNAGNTGQYLYDAFVWNNSRKQNF